ncbi:MAG: alpha-amylase family glycosyl hydrolase, partial [Desulfobacterales bacterium]|nr:alpha-amylase family glycosyl hydrolase [Desulfobacterales bacterium]
MHPESLATYRIQMRSGFDFKQAAAVAPYLAALGISHFYASPYLQAAEGSTHGYDIVDPTRVDASLGGEEARRHFCRALQSCGLFQMIDLVPNHMAIIGRWNPWWWDVLENGPASRYAAFFDVDWQPRGEHWPDKVLLPVLINHYGRVLENGELSLCHSRGNFEIRCHDQQFPVNMNSLYEILAQAAKSSGSALLAFLAECCNATPASMETRSRQDRSRSYSVLKQLLARLCLDEPETAGAIDQEVRRI